MTKEQWREHLKNLLSDVVSEYLNSEDVEAEDLIEDIRQELKSWMDYHAQQELKASKVYHNIK